MSESPAPSANLRRTVPLLMLVVACGHFNRIGISVVGAERLIPSNGISPEKMGMVYSAFLFAYTLSMLPGGWLIDRFGARAALTLLGFGSVLFVGLSACTTFSGGQVNSLWFSLLLIRALLGIVNAPLHPASARMISDQVDPSWRVLANGLVTFGACVGIASTYRVIGTLIDWFDWPAALGICSAITLAVTLLWTISTQAIPAPRSVHTDSNTSGSFAELKQVLLQRSVICITLSYTALGYFQYLFFYWVQYFFESILHQDRTVARDYSTLITGSMGIGMVCGGWLADRVPLFLSPGLRRSLVPVVGMTSSGTIAVLALLIESPEATFAALAVAAFMIGAAEGSFWSTSVELGGRYGGTTASFMNTGCNLGGTLSPVLVPMISRLLESAYGEQTGWKISLAIAGIIVIVGASLWWWITPPTEPSTTET